MSNDIDINDKLDEIKIEEENTENSTQEVSNSDSNPQNHGNEITNSGEVVTENKVAVDNDQNIVSDEKKSEKTIEEKQNKSSSKISNYLKDSNGDKFSKNWMTFYMVTLIVLIFSELYVTVQSNNNYIVFIGLLVVIAIFSYLAIDELVKLARTVREHENNKIDLHIKSQKAIYSVINKKMDQVNTRISQLDHELNHNNENYNNIMKAVAKVIIKKNHEFSNNIINGMKTSKETTIENVNNSIDLSEVINKIEEFENNINNNISSSIDISNQGNEYLQRIIDLLDKNASDLKDMITKIEESPKTKVKKKVEKKTDLKTDQKINQKSNKKTDQKTEQNLKEEAEQESEILIDDIDQVDSKDVSDNKEVSDRKDVSDNKEVSDSKDITDSKDMTGQETLKESIDENKNTEDILGIGNDNSKEEYKVELPEEVDLSDPNKQLSPEEISALFASIQ